MVSLKDPGNRMTPAGNTSRVQGFRAHSVVSTTVEIYPVSVTIELLQENIFPWMHMDQLPN